jgi:hypothetical protein
LGTVQPTVKLIQSKALPTTNVATEYSISHNHNHDSNDRHDRQDNHHHHEHDDSNDLRDTSPNVNNKKT